MLSQNFGLKCGLRPNCHHKVKFGLKLRLRSNFTLRLYSNTNTLVLADGLRLKLTLPCIYC